MLYEMFDSALLTLHISEINRKIYNDWLLTLYIGWYVPHVASAWCRGISLKSIAIDTNQIWKKGTFSHINKKRKFCLYYKGAKHIARFFCTILWLYSRLYWSFLSNILSVTTLTFEIAPLTLCASRLLHPCSIL